MDRAFFTSKQQNSSYSLIHDGREDDNLIQNEQIPRGVLEVYMTGGGGSDGASYCKPNNIHKPEILDPKKYLASKFPTQKNTRLKYLNTDLFN